MSASKTDCTIQQGNFFKVLLVCCQPQNSVTDKRIKQVEEVLAANNDVRILNHTMVLNAEDVGRLVRYALSEKPQALIMFSEAQAIQIAKLLSETYNNCFHNSPAILFTEMPQEQFVEGIKANASIDIAINNDTALLGNLIRNISARKHNDDPIDFSLLKGLAYRSHGPVVFI